MSLRLAILLIVVSQVVGCATIRLQFDPEAQIDSWLSEHEYQKVMKALSQDPSLPFSMQSIKKQSANYERQIIKQAGKLQNKGLYHEAITLYQSVLDKIPESKTVNRNLDSLLKQQQRDQDELTFTLLIEQANWLQRQIAIQKLLVQTNPDDSDYSYALSISNKEANSLVWSLTAETEKALERADIKKANRALTAITLLADEANANDVASLEKRVLQKMESQQRQLNKIELKQQNTRLKQAEQALSENNLLLAKDILDDLPLSTKKSLYLRQQLEQSIEERIRLRIRQGNTLYSRGNYEAAIAIWQESQKLVPDSPELINLIGRAEHVIQTLNKLEKKQQAGQ